MKTPKFKTKDTCTNCQHDGMIYEHWQKHCNMYYAYLSCPKCKIKSEIGVEKCNLPEEWVKKIDLYEKKKNEAIEKEVFGRSKENRIE